MPLYKFYRIVSKTEADGECYIGHTIQPLHKRFYGHGSPSNKCSSRVLFEKYGKENLEIVLIHEMEFENKQEAVREERRLFEEYAEKRVNIRYPFRSEQETKEKDNEYCSLWREINKEKANDSSRAWYETNKERNAENTRIWREANKAKYNETTRVWRETNKDKINEQRKRKRALAKQPPITESSPHEP
jgi:predicted GIY-YIG superfamily endonuclease